MDPLEPVENNDATKLTPSPSSRSFIVFVALIVALQILIAVISYPFLPDQVPSHWNAAGEVNGYMPKLLNAVVFPALSILLAVLVRGLIAIGPRLGRDNQRGALKYTERFLPGVLLFFVAIQLITIASALKLPVDRPFIMSLLVSVLFIFLGNYMGKLRRNFWAGIRTPWTMVSDTVWERTHRLGGWLFVALGLLGLVMSFIPFLRLWAVIGGVLLISAVLFVYSYLVYRQVESSRKEPFSPPFDDET